MDIYALFYAFVMGFSCMAVTLIAWYTYKWKVQRGRNEIDHSHRETKTNMRGTDKFLLEGRIDEETSRREAAAFQEAKHEFPAMEDFQHHRPELPDFTAEEIKQHNKDSPEIWTTLEKGVYDITEYSKRHPGGDIILNGAGGAMDDYWEILQQHKSPAILLILRHMRIGNYTGDKRELGVKGIKGYINEPERDPNLQSWLAHPFNATPRPRLLMDSYITPAKIQYVRNHVEVPRIDESQHTLEITGLGVEGGRKVLTMEDLKTKFRERVLLATIECSGNRRREMHKIRRVNGVKWDHGAIGNFYWHGVYLHEVLRWAGVTDETPNAYHVHFEGLDVDPMGEPYGISIPFDMIMDPVSEALLVYGVNGEPLLPDHGFPLRSFIPGGVGARCVKWLFRIHIASTESTNYAQRIDNKLYPPDVDWETADFDGTPALQDMPVISAICVPEDNTEISVIDKSFTAKGYAWSGGGRRILRVDLSYDGGEEWHAVKLHEERNPKSHRIWAWTQWHFNVPLDSYRAGDTLTLVCRAVDDSLAVQPATFKPIWNILGEGANAYHQITVRLIE